MRGGEGWPDLGRARGREAMREAAREGWWDGGREARERRRGSGGMEAGRTYRGRQMPHLREHHADLASSGILPADELAAHYAQAALPFQAAGRGTGHLAWVRVSAFFCREV